MRADKKKPINKQKPKINSSEESLLIKKKAVESLSKAKVLETERILSKTYRYVLSRLRPRTYTLMKKE